MLSNRLFGDRLLRTLAGQGDKHILKIRLTRGDIDNAQAQFADEGEDLPRVRHVLVIRNF